MAVKKVVVDAGNGGTNAALAKGKSYTLVQYPSVRASATGDSLGLGGQFEKDTEWVEFGGHRYFVGDDAPLASGSLERHQGAFRYGDEFHLFLIAVAIGKLGIKSGDIDLTTFAPPGMYADAKRDIQSRINKLGNKLAIQFKADKKPRVFNIVNLTVHPEGLGALLCFVMDNKGNVVNKDLLAGENVVLDMGMYTLDALQISNGQFNPESLSSATWENGGIKVHILDPILRAVKTKGGDDFSLLTSDDIDRCIRQHINTGEYALSVAGQDVDITPLVTKYSEAYARWIANNIIDGVFNGLRGIKSIILVGGGATFTRDYFAKWYDGTKILNTDKAARGIAPVDMNAIGGLRLALSKQEA